MFDHYWKEILAFRPVQKLTNAYWGEPSCLNEGRCPKADTQITLGDEGCSILRQWTRRSRGICHQFSPHIFRTILANPYKHSINKDKTLQIH